MGSKEVRDDLFGFLQVLNDLVDRFENALLLHTITTAVGMISQMNTRKSSRKMYLKIFTMSSKASRKGLSATRNSSAVSVPGTQT